MDFATARDDNRNTIRRAQLLSHHHHQHINAQLLQAGCPSYRLELELEYEFETGNGMYFTESSGQEYSWCRKLRLRQDVRSAGQHPFNNIFFIYLFIKRLKFDSQISTLYTGLLNFNYDLQLHTCSIRSKLVQTRIFATVTVSVCSSYICYCDTEFWQHSACTWF